MTEFDVDLQGLGGLPDAMERWETFARRAVSHFDDTKISWSGEGLANLLSTGHDTVRDQVESFFTTLRDDVAGTSADNLRATIASYRSTDAAQRRTYDSTLPGGDVRAALAVLPPVMSLGPHAAFADVSSPTARLTPPPDYNSEYPYEPGWKDLISPSSVLRDAIWGVTSAAASIGVCDRAYDPFEVALKPLLGDWAGIRACADVLDDLGLACADLSRNVAWAASSTRPVWSGNAADSCVAYLYRLTGPLVEAQTALAKLSGEYENAAQGAFDVSRAIGVILSDIADAAITAAASAAITGLAGSTGVGLPLALLIGAFTLTRVYKVVKGVYGIIDLLVRLEAVVSATKGAQGDFGRIDATASLPRLPGPTGTPR